MVCSEIQKFYGPTFCTYNVHNLVQLRDDLVNHNDNLNAISAFELENKLQSIKKLVRPSCNPLSQIVKQISELEDANKSFLKIYIFDKVSIIECDSWFLLKSSIYICVKEIISNDTLVCHFINENQLESLFHEPLNSKEIRICVFHGKVSRKRTQILKSDIDRKIVCLSRLKDIVLIHFFMKFYGVRYINNFVRILDLLTTVKCLILVLMD